MRDELRFTTRGTALLLRCASASKSSARSVSLIALSLACISFGPLRGQQSSADKPQFEVVSIRPNNSGRVGNIGFLRDGYRGEDVSLPALILEAYGLERRYQLLGLPKWAQSAHYDIEAKVRESDVPMMRRLGYSQLSRMFQPVLENRFSFQCHWEKRTLPAYSLRVSDKDKQLKKLEAVDDGKTVHVGSANLSGKGVSAKSADGKFVARGIRIQQLASMLAGEIDTAVIDGTGLTGEYDFEMQLSPSRTDAGLPHSPDQIDAQEQIQDGLYQLGLKLVPIKAELPVLVIDQLKPPSPN